MKSLAQEIENIKNAKTTATAKKAALVKLGLLPYEASMAVASWRAPRNTAASARVSFTFGVEIECDVPRYSLRSAAAETGMNYNYEGYNHRDGFSYFKFVSDASLRVNGNEIECVSPVLKGKNGLASLKTCCDTLNRAGAQVNRSCGLHVHIGAADLTGEQYVNVFHNYRLLESIIDTFMAPSRRENNSQWCHGITSYVFNTCHTQSDVYDMMGGRYFKVNPAAYRTHNTIEFRQHQGTTDYEKISNWVAFCGKLVCWSKNNRLTAPVANIGDIPFLTAKEKAFFNARAEQLCR